MFIFQDIYNTINVTQLSFLKKEADNRFISLLNAQQR